MIVLHDMATFLIDYVNRAVLWPIGIDPMLKNLAAITGYSYESHLAFFLPKGLKVSAVHKGLNQAPDGQVVRQRVISKGVWVVVPVPGAWGSGCAGTWL